MAKAKTLFVRSATKDRKVALSETSKAHPNGEAWVVGYPDLPDGTEDPANVVEVGDTPLVRAKLASGELLEVELEDVPAKKTTRTARQPSSGNQPGGTPPPSTGPGSGDTGDK